VLYLRWREYFMNKYLAVLLHLLFGSISLSQDVNFTSSNLPIVVINTGGEDIPNEPKIPAQMGIIYNGNGEINHINDSYNHYNGHIGIERRGHSSQNFPKKQYSIETRYENGDNYNTSIFEMPEENDWVLSGPYSDKSLIRNVLAYDIARSLGFYASRAQFCEVVLNDDYVGVYVFMEKIKVDNNRVDIANPTQNNVSGGYLLEIEAWNRVDSSDTYISGETINLPYLIHHPKDDDITDEQIQWIQNYVDDFENNLYSNDFDNPNTGNSNYIHVPSWIDFILLNEAFRNNDAFFSSTFLQKRQSGKLVAGPIWDFNIAMGNINYNNNWLTNDLWLTENPWSSRLMIDSHFIKTYQIRWHYLRTNQLSDSVITERINQYSFLLEEAQERNFIKWPILGEYIWPNYYIGDTFEDEINYLKQWILNRFSWMDIEFDLNGETYPIINEINYHSSNQFDSGDWIELFNPNSIPVDISNYILKDENEDHYYIIPENTEIDSMGFIIVCQEPAIFNLIFPQVENYIGGFDFGFSNGGELIRLFNSDGTLVDYVDYDDNTPWPEMPDGGGATLELKSMPRDNYHFSNWKESPGFGTPGQINSVTLNTNNANNINPNQYFILNYPNPFNPNTTIRYQLPVQSNVSIIIYDITGKEIRHLVNDVQDAGFNSVVWNATNDLSQPVSAGIYLYRIAAEDFQQVKKMVFLK
jgi:hypothetical protein